jgi:hypothetical protein
MVGANKTGLVYAGPHFYNLKGKVNRKFLHWEFQDVRGVDLGWTDNASASTADKNSKWFFQNQPNTTDPIRYGEPISLGFGGGKPGYYKYSGRAIGINLDKSKKPSYEWAILGKKPGEPVKRGVDWVVIYNLKHKQPLIYFDRTAGGDIGWPDSTRWGTTIVSGGRHIQIEEVVKPLLMPGVPGSNR